MQRRDDDRSGNGEQDDDRPDPEHPAARTFADLARGNQRDVAVQRYLQRRGPRTCPRACCRRRRRTIRARQRECCREDEVGQHRASCRPRGQRFSKDLGQPAAFEAELQHRPGPHRGGQYDLRIGVVIESEPHRSAVHPRHPGAQQLSGPGAGMVSIDLHHQPAASARRQVLDRARATSRPWSMIATDVHRSSTRSSWWLENSTPRPSPLARSTPRRPRRYRPGPARTTVRPGSAAPARAPAPPPAGPAADCPATASRPCWCPVGYAEALQPAGRRRAGIVRAQPVQSGQVLQLLTDDHARVQAALLGHVAEPATIRGGSIGCPFHRTLPESSAISPKTARIAVVLPEPFGPRNPTTSPAGTVKAGHRGQVPRRTDGSTRQSPESRTLPCQADSHMLRVAVVTSRHSNSSGKVENRQFRTGRHATGRRRPGRSRRWCGSTPGWRQRRPCERSRRGSPSAWWG